MSNQTTRKEKIADRVQICDYCDKKIEIGSKIIIKGEKYVCETGTGWNYSFFCSMECEDDLVIEAAEEEGSFTRPRID